MSDFVFKHFTVRQQHSAMKIGTDSVLLGCLVEINHSTRILDIGTGTGLLALMLAQRSNANIVAVEVDELAAMEATFNFKQSKWAHRITLHHKSIQQFSKEQHPKFDLIVSNPPYYAIQQHSAIAQKTRSIARHTNLLSYLTMGYTHAILKACLPNYSSLAQAAQSRPYQRSPGGWRCSFSNFPPPASLFLGLARPLPRL